MSRLGTRQIRRLCILASAALGLLTPGRTDRSLVARGLFRERKPNGAIVITPAGLRALANEMEAGRVDPVLEEWQRESDRRRSEGRA